MHNIFFIDLAKRPLYGIARRNICYCTKIVSEIYTFFRKYFKENCKNRFHFFEIWPHLGRTDGVIFLQICHFSVRLLHLLFQNHEEIKYRTYSGTLISKIVLFW